MRPFITILLFSLILAGCYSEKKAAQQSARALAAYPDTVGGMFRRVFPCISKPQVITKIISDSADYLETIESLQTQLYLMYNSYDSLLKTRPVGDTSCSQYTSTIQRLQEQITLLKYRINHIPPIHDTVKIETPVADMFQVDSSNRAAAKWRDMYLADHAWRTNKEAKEKGKFALLIPWWLIILLIILGSGAVITKIKTGGFNPLAFINKKPSA